MTSIKTGLVGFGTGGAFFHAPFIDAMEEFELTAIVERSAEKSKEKFPNTKIVRSIEELLTIKEIELVVITTPNDTHFDLASKALRSGKHVALDKPFTVTSEEGEKLITIAKEENRLLTVYHNRRFHSDFKTLQSIIDKKQVGEIVEFEACFDRYRPELRPNVWKESDRPGAGILYDLGSHLIDQSLTLFGRPTYISAKMGIERPKGGAIDNFELVFHYPNFKSYLRAGMLVEKPGPIFRVEGTSGTYTKYGLDPQENLLREGIKPINKPWAVEGKQYWGTLTQEGAESSIEPIYSDYTVWYRNLADAIRKGKTLEVTPQEALLVIKCIELSINSNVENNAKLRL